jgi:hypothetical protein
MGEERKCPLYRKSEGLSFGKGIGYCDMDSSSATCDGDPKFCEKPDALKRYLLAKLEDWEKRQKK